MHSRSAASTEPSGDKSNRHIRRLQLTLSWMPPGEFPRGDSGVLHGPDRRVALRRRHAATCRPICFKNRTSAPIENRLPSLYVPVYFCLAGRGYLGYAQRQLKLKAVAFRTSSEVIATPFTTPPPASSASTSRACLPPGVIVSSAGCSGCDILFETRLTLFNLPKVCMCLYGKRLLVQRWTLSVVAASQLGGHTTPTRLQGRCTPDRKPMSLVGVEACASLGRKSNSPTHRAMIPTESTAAVGCV